MENTTNNRPTATNKLREFSEFRTEMNEKIWSQNNKVINRIFNLDQATYQDGYLPSKVKEMMGLIEKAKAPKEKKEKKADTGAKSKHEKGETKEEEKSKVEEAKNNNKIEWTSSDFSPIEGIKIKKGDKGEIVTHDTGNQYLVKFNNHRFYAQKTKNFKDLDEARFEKGTDIGKPGAGFAKVAKAASKEYGSKEAGQKVAGAILKKVMAKK